MRVRSILSSVVAALTVAASAAVAQQPASGSEVQVNKFMRYDPARKIVSIDVFAAWNNKQGGFNFNGGSNGGDTITVPQGWTVKMHVVNKDAIPHSAIIITDAQPLPSAPQTAAIPRAYTAHLSDGLPPVDGSDDLNFRAAKAGTYYLACGVPGHAPSGMYIVFQVSAAADRPSYAMHGLQ